MRFCILMLAVFLCAGGVYAQGGDKKSLAGFKNEDEKVSYAIGLNIGRSLKQQGVDVDMAALMQGIQDVLKNKKPRLSRQEAQTTMQKIGAKLQARKQERRAKAAATNKREGTAFLAKNKEKKGVVTLPSGLQYQVLRKGKGKKPMATDTVVTHYRGTLLDGSEFDSSYGRGQPATFPVQGVIPGWIEALQLMRVGAKWKLFIPSGLAYGERGSGRSIGANATLVFEIELVKIK